MPETVLAIIQNQEGNILVGEVSAEKQEELGGIQYVFPGGKVENGESLEDAVVREVREETGLAVKVVERIANRIHPITKKSINYYACILINDDEKVPDGELKRLVWVTVGELKSYMPTLYSKVSEYLKI